MIRSGPGGASVRWLSSLVVLISAIVSIIGCGPLDVRFGDVLLTELGNWRDDRGQVVIVAINENTLAKLPYRSPIDRGFLADVVGHIDSGEPKAIGIDVLVDQPSEKNKDGRFLKTVTAARTPVVMAYATVGDGLTAKQSVYLSDTLSGIPKGTVTLWRDRFDGTVRHWPDRRAEAESSSRLFSKELARLASGSTSDAVGRIIYYKRSSPSQNSFAEYPAHSIRLIPKDWFKDKIVLVGATLPGIDQHRTPVVTANGVAAGTAHGVVVHAHMITQLLRGDRVVTLPLAANVFLCLAIAAATAGVTLSRWSLLVRLFGLAGVLTATAAAAPAIFLVADVEFATVSVLCSGLLTSAVLATNRWYRDYADRRFIKHAFGRYLSPVVVNKIASDPGHLTLGGEVRTMTLVFTDLEGFTKLAEQLEPVDVATILNSYLDGVCTLFTEHGATIDKIVGDAVVGFFGAPDDQPNKDQRAVELALAINEFSEAFRIEQNRHRIELGATRIGIHTGQALVGNFGGSRFFDYTAVGDTVNTAARMESANKNFGTRICVSQHVADACTNIAFRPIGDLVFKGKTESITCLEVLGPDADANKYLAEYLNAFRLMRNGDPTALETFCRLAKSYPQDRLIRFQEARLREGPSSARIVMTDM